MHQEQTFWSKLKEKKPALVSFFAIICMAVFSLFAYLIVGDNSPNANMQFPEIGLKPMGFQTKTILLKNAVPSETNWFSGLFFGFEPKEKAYPVLSVAESEGIVKVVNHYNVEKTISKEHLYHNQLQTGSKTYYLGTDKFGRSIASRLLLGIRISLLVGLIAVLISLFVGILIGSLGGYFGGWIDRLVMYLINVTWSIPTLLLVFAIVLAFGRGIGIIFLAVGLTMWVDVARIVRGQVKKVREEQFVTAAKSIGVREQSILFNHILPNIIGPILVIGAANFATAILIEAGLSYLGFGVKPPTPSIGNMLNEHYGYAITGKPFLAIIPAITIMVMVLAFNLLGSGLRDIFDVRND